MENNSDKNTDHTIDLERQRDNWRILVDSFYDILLKDFPQYANENDDAEKATNYLNTLLYEMTTKGNTFFSFFDCGATLLRYIILMRKGIEPLQFLYYRADKLLSEGVLEHHRSVVNELTLLILAHLSNDQYSVEYELDALDTELAEAPEEEEAVAEYLQSRIPQEYLIPTDSVAREISSRKDMLYRKDEMPQTIELSAKWKRGNDIKTYCYLQYEADDFDEVYPKGLTAYDMAVHNAVCTLYEAGNSLFTVEMVYRAMNGLRHTESVSRESTRRISGIIDKMMFTKVSIDCTDEVRSRGWKDIEQEIIAPMLSAVKSKISAPSGDLIAYKLLTKPVIFLLSQKKRQIANVPLQVLETNKAYISAEGKSVSGVRNSENVTVIREYLVRRIEGMRNPNNKLASKHILFESIWEKCDIETRERRALARLRGYIESILDYWVVIGYIKGYQYMKGPKNSVKGVDVDVDSQPYHLATIPHN